MKKAAVFTAIFLFVLLTACSVTNYRSNVQAAATVAADVQAALDGATIATIESQETPIVVTSTPRPTKEPGVVDEAVSTVASATNLDQITFLGLTGEDWINVIVSVLTIFVGYLITTFVFMRSLRWLVRKTPTQFDDAFLDTIHGPLRFFVLVLFVQLSLLRLTFLDEEVVRFLNNIFFILYLSILFLIIWRLIGFALDWYREHVTPKDEEQEARREKTLPLIRRILHVTWIVIVFMMILSHWNINITGLVAIIGIGGLAISLAAQDTINDFINGILIWIDRPFRIGDRIEIQGKNTWGDVTDIGARTTRIRTRNNVMVIVPNSVIGKNQVINFTYPDPRFRTEVEFQLDYKEDLNHIRRVVVEGVRSVEGVIEDEPVDALFRDFGHSTIIFRVRWWIDSYSDTYIISDKVNSAILDALNEAGIEVAYPSKKLEV
jgi:small-conductance mechanosensitive channel